MMKLGYVATIGCLGLLVGCGDSGLGADDLPISSITKVRPEPEGTACPAGGQVIESGLDANRNGQLDPSEVKETSYVCTPEVESPRQALVRIDNVGPGEACAHGGFLVNAGVDADGDGSLGDDEVTETALSCAAVNGSDGASGNNGANGSDGDNGIDVLVLSQPVAPGLECVHGGTRMLAGQDTNANGQLEESEATAVLLVCSVNNRRYVETGEFDLPEGFVAQYVQVYASGAPAADLDGDGYSDVAADGDVLAVRSGLKFAFYERVGAQWSLVNQLDSPCGFTPFTTVVGFEKGIMVLTGSLGPSQVYRSCIVEKVSGSYAVTDTITTNNHQNGNGVIARDFDGEHILIAGETSWGNQRWIARKVAGAPVSQGQPLLLPPNHSVTGQAQTLKRGLVVVPASLSGSPGLTVMKLTAGATSYHGRIPNNYAGAIEISVVGDQDVIVAEIPNPSNGPWTNKVWRRASNGDWGTVQTMSGGVNIRLPLYAQSATLLLSMGGDPALGDHITAYEYTDGFWRSFQVMTTYMSGAAMLAGGEELYVTDSTSLRVYTLQ